MPEWVSSLWGSITTPPLSNEIALAVSVIAILISLLSFFQRGKEYRLTVRRQLTDYLAKLHDLNLEYAKAHSPATRTEYPLHFDRLIIDQRRFVTRQANYLANKIPGTVTPYEWMVIATSMDDIGELHLAETYFRKAFFWKGLGQFEQAIFARQYARFQFRNGHPAEGRRLYAFAAEHLAGDTARHQIYLGDTYERWARAEAEFGDKTKVGELLARAATAYGLLTDSPAKQGFAHHVDRLRTEYEVPADAPEEPANA